MWEHESEQDLCHLAACRAPPRPPQADAIRQAAEWVLAGWALSNVAVELRKRCLRGAHGGEITPQAVRSMVTVPTVAGYRVHRGRVVGRGNWAPILDDDTWQACRLKLSQPRRVTRKDGGTYPVTERHQGNSTGRKYLLTGGLARCGVCKHRMAGAVEQMKNQKAPYLHCHPNAGGRGCTGTLLDNAEAHVISELWAELDKPEFLNAIAADEHGARRDAIATALDGIEKKRGELAAMWATPGGLSDTEWKEARNALAESERELRRELVELPPPVVNVDIEAARAAWPNMTVDEKGEFLRLFIAAVWVYKAPPGRPRVFDPERLKIDWRMA